MKKQFLIALCTALCSSSLMFGMEINAPKEIVAHFRALVEKECANSDEINKQSLDRIKQEYVGAFLELCALEAQNNIMHSAAVSAQNQDSRLLNQILEQNKCITTEIIRLRDTGILEFFYEDEIEEFQEGVIAIYEQAWEGSKIPSAL